MTEPGGLRLQDRTTDNLVAETARSALVWTAARWRWLIGLVLTLLLTAFPTFPGRANHDTDAMVTNMDAGQYTDWWSPTLMMLWRPAYELGAGLGFVLVLQITVFFVAVGSLVRPVCSSQLTAICASVAVCLFPTVYGMLILVIRDTWYAVAIVATLAVIARTRQPTALHGALFAVGSFAVVAARQNGIVTVVVLTIMALAHWRLLYLQGSAIRRWIWWAALGAATGVFALLGMRIVLAVTDVSITGPETATYYVDLDEMSTRVGEMLVPDVYFPEPITLEQLGEYRNYSVNDIRDRAIFRLPDEDQAVASEAWRDAITEYPYVYFQARWQMFTRQIGWSGTPLEAYYTTDGTSQIFAARSFDLSELSTSYLSMFDGGNWEQGGIVHRPWIYMLVSAVAALRFGRRWPMLVAIPALQLSVIGGLFFLSPISKSRLVFAVFALGAVSAVYLVGGGRRPSTSSSASPSPNPSRNPSTSPETI